MFPTAYKASISGTSIQLYHSKETEYSQCSHSRWNQVKAVTL